MCERARLICLTTIPAFLLAAASLRAGHAEELLLAGLPALPARVILQMADGEAVTLPAAALTHAGDGWQVRLPVRAPDPRRLPSGLAGGRPSGDGMPVRVTVEMASSPDGPQSCVGAARLASPFPVRLAMWSCR